MSDTSARSEQDTVWLTQEAYDKLTAELEHLRGPARQEVVARISSARDEGDLKENGGYHAAKEEQGKLELRIRQVEEMLRLAEVGAADDDGTISPGFVVTYRFVGDDDTSTFLLGAREIEDDNLGLYGPIVQGWGKDAGQLKDALTFEALVQFLADKEIAKYKLPERLELLADFPVSTFGKVSKKRLSELASERAVARTKPPRA